MKTRIGTSVGLALMFVMGVIVTMLALGTFSLSKVQAGQATNNAPSASPAARVNALAVGGPVLLDGGDFPDHGSFSNGQLQNAWRYAGSAVANVLPQVTRAGNDGSIALLGSADSTDTSGNTGGNYHYVAIVNGVTVTYHDGTAAINLFFTNLASGAVNPAVIVTAGTGATNDLDSDAEGDALSNNSQAIADFVNSGGGLIGHGSGSRAFGWLQSLLPGINFPSGCDNNTLSLTAAGQTAFPSLTNADIQSGVCHGNFTGDLGGLGILAKDGQNRNIILGGSAVSLPGSLTLTPTTDTNAPGTSHTVTATVKDSNGNLQSGKLVTFTVAGVNGGASGICVPASCVSGADGQVTFRYTGNNAGADTITASFVDDDSNTQAVAVTKTWGVEGNRPPVIATIQDPGVNEGDILNFSVSATDPDGDAVTMSVTGSLPSFASFTPTTGAGTFNFSPGSNDSGAYPITIIASDGSLTDSAIFTLSVFEFPHPEGDDDDPIVDDEPIVTTVPTEIKVPIPTLKGDYNGDGRITASDALAALKMSLGELPEDLNLDLDGDGRVTVDDARQLLTAALAALAGT